jgi:hypothetical protein
MAQTDRDNALTHLMDERKSQARENEARPSSLQCRCRSTHLPFCKVNYRMLTYTAYFWATGSSQIKCSKSLDLTFLQRYGLLGCDAVESGACSPTFQRNILPPSSVSNSGSRNQAAEGYFGGNVLLLSSGSIIYRLVYCSTMK